MEAKDPFSRGFLCLDCCIGEMFDNRQFKKKEGLEFGLVLYVKCNAESVDHLFLHCPVAMDLQSMVIGLFGVSWVMPKSVIGPLAC